MILIRNLKKTIRFNKKTTPLTPQTLVNRAARESFSKKKKKKHGFSWKIDPLYRNSPKNYAKPLIFQGFLKKSWKNIGNSLFFDSFWANSYIRGQFLVKNLVFFFFFAETFSGWLTGLWSWGSYTLAVRHLKKTVDFNKKS